MPLLCFPLRRCCVVVCFDFLVVVCLLPVSLPSSSYYSSPHLILTLCLLFELPARLFEFYIGLLKATGLLGDSDASAILSSAEEAGYPPMGEAPRAMDQDYNLLMTKEWMLIVPRRSRDPKTQPPVANGLLFAGLVLEKVGEGEDARMIVEKANYEKVMTDTTLPLR